MVKPKVFEFMINLIIFPTANNPPFRNHSSSEIEDEDMYNELEDDYDGEMVDDYNDDEFDIDHYSLSDHDYTRYSYAGHTPPPSSVQLHSISVPHSTQVKLRCCSY